MRATVATIDPIEAGAGPRRERRKDDRPGELVNAALDVFAERGFAGARLEDIARRAGVTKGTVYLYFARAAGGDEKVSLGFSRRRGTWNNQQQRAR